MKNKIIIFLLFLFFLSAVALAKAEAEENLEEICLEVIDKGQQNVSKENYQALLKKCLAFYEEEITEIQKDLSKTGVEKKTLENKIYTLNKKIKNLNYQIYQSNLIVKDLGIQIEDTEGSIEKTSLKIEDSKEKLANILRSIYEEDQKPIIEILLSGNNLSDFFDNLTALEALNLKNKELLQNIKTLKSNLEEQKRSLDEEKGDLERMVKIYAFQKEESSKIKKEQEYFWNLTEKEYQKYLAEKQEAEKKTAKIRARIWKLIGVREAPKYEEAVKIAIEVSQIGRIRPAFLLGVLTQESNMGKDVGQCYLQDPDTGLGVKFKTNKKWPRVMKPTWTSLFLEAIKALNEQKNLNLDPFATPISCWIPACANRYRVYQGSKYVSIDSEGNITCHCKNCVPFGWGGAMGPAQLMPFNWIGSDNYKAKIEAITGRVADPWDFYDSALGAVLHLKDCGGDVNERRAAACYFGGWGNRNTAYHLRVYADPVLALSKCHQQFIDTGTMSANCERWIF